MVHRKGLVTAVLSACLMLSCFAFAQERHDRDHEQDRKCQQRIHKAEGNLQQAIRKHGERSKQAEKRRHELEQARERCGHHDRDHDHDKH